MSVFSTFIGQLVMIVILILIAVVFYLIVSGKPIDQVVKMPEGRKPGDKTDGRQPTATMSRAVLLVSTDHGDQRFDVPMSLEENHPLWIGRDDERNWANINDNSVGRRHCRLGYDAKGYYILDGEGVVNGKIVNPSKNGIYVYDKETGEPKRVSQINIVPNEPFCIGLALCRLEVVNPFDRQQSVSFEEESEDDGFKRIY
ncbi:MAG: FHA domain-containing protein [bacterium]